MKFELLKDVHIPSHMRHFLENKYTRFLITKNKNQYISNKCIGIYSLEINIFKSNWYLSFYIFRCLLIYHLQIGSEDTLRIILY